MEISREKALEAVEKTDVNVQGEEEWNEGQFLPPSTLNHPEFVQKNPTNEQTKKHSNTKTTIMCPSIQNLTPFFLKLFF